MSSLGSTADGAAGGRGDSPRRAFPILDKNPCASNLEPVVGNEVSRDSGRGRAWHPRIYAKRSSIRDLGGSPRAAHFPSKFLGEPR